MQMVTGNLLLPSVVFPLLVQCTIVVFAWRDSAKPKKLQSEWPVSPSTPKTDKPPPINIISAFPGVNRLFIILLLNVI